MDIQNNSLNLETSEPNLKAGLNQVFHWKKKEHYYSVQLICDLFGNHEVITKTRVKEGAYLIPSKTYKDSYSTEDQALKAIAQLKVKLTRLGYHQVFTEPSALA